MISTMPRSASYGILPISVKKQGKGRCMEPDNCKPDHPKFKVNKRSMRDRLTLLITEHKAKIRQEENVAGITCKEIELNPALEEIIDRRSWPTEKAPR